MKKIISVILLIMMLAGQCTVFAEEAVDTGIWEKRAYVDEFDLPTDEYYISNKEPIVGKFSNSATTDSLLNAWLYVDDNIVTIKLIEYGNHVVKNSYSREQYYDVVMMDPAGDKHYFDGYMESGREVITFNQENSNTIIKAMCGNGTVRFAITETDNETTKYILTIDDTTGFVNYLPYERVLAFSEGLAYVKKANKYGYIDTTGTLVIPLEYDNTRDFSEGVARVVHGDKVGYIDTMGRIIVPFEYNDGDNFYEGLACVARNGKAGFVDVTGSVIIPFDYDDASNFREGFAPVKKDGKWGFVDKTGTVIVPCEYADVRDFYEGLALVKQSGKWGYVDVTGTLVIPCEYDLAGSFHDGMSYVYMDDKELYGFINTSGMLVVPIEYESVSLIGFSEGLASVQKDGKYGFIDTTGTEVVPFEYDEAGNFVDGLACVRKNGLWGCIDKTGTLVTPCEYDVADNSFYRLTRVQKNGKWGFLNTTGELMIPCEYDSVAYGEGYFTLLKDGEITIISRDEIQPNWEKELAMLEQELAKQAEVRRIEAEKQKMLKEYTDKETVKAVQTALNAAGYDCGKPDGIAGKGTAGAVTNYQTDKALNITGTITHELLISLGVIAE